MIVTASQWDDFLAEYPNAHILQSAQWGELKASFGWEVARVIYDNAGAQILFRNVLLGFTIAYIPKGPVGVATESFWQMVKQLCHSKKAIFLKVEPDIWETSVPNNEAGVMPRGFQLGRHTIQPPRTLMVDLSGSEDQIMGRMKQKTRYNIRLARKKNVVVRTSGNLDIFSTLMQVTGERDQFGVHGRDYYQKAYDLFHPHATCELFVAEYDHQPLGGVMVFAHGERAWYFYGASDNAHRNRMPNYLLQWEAMRWARERGCTQYDLWGVPDADLDTLEREFTTRMDNLWGVYRFKRGFGGQLRRSTGPWDQVYHPLTYQLIIWWTALGSGRSGAG